MQNLHLLEHSAEDFGFHVDWNDGARFLVHIGWNTRDLNMTGVCDCLKDCVGLKSNWSFSILVGDFF